MFSRLTHHARHKGVATNRPFAAALAAALTACAMLVGVAAAEAKPAPPGPGNAPGAKACQKGGWDNYVTATGGDFASEEECTSYAAQGGVLVADSVVARCLDGGWQNLVRATSDGGTAFASEQECRSYAAQGGVLEEKPTDVCPNIDGTQTTVPARHVKDSAGDCVLTPYGQWHVACQTSTRAGTPLDQGSRWLCIWAVGVVPASDDLTELATICQAAGGTFDFNDRSLERVAACDEFG